MHRRLTKSSLNLLQKAAATSSYSTAPSRGSPYASDPAKMKTKYDAVIVGAGHNGLVAANYLAKFSGKRDLKVCVLESRDVLGGAAVTEELVPGFKFSRASYLLSLFRPVILKDLDLMRHGMLKFYTRDPSSYTPLHETDPQYTAKSRSLTLSASAEFNRAEISKFSTRDAQRYEEYEAWLGRICDVLERFMDTAPPSLAVLKSKRTLISKLNYLRQYVADFESARFLANNYEDIYRLFSDPASNILNEWFESDVLKATLATDSVIGAMLAPSSPGSAYVLLHHIIGGIDGKKGMNTELNLQMRIT
jgi:phytoene dehydrogenase-like protein